MLTFANHPNIDEFIFASTWPRDQQLQDEADKLAKKYGKCVHIWSWDDLVDYVNAHPRLQRLFAQGHAPFGVDLIDADFIDGLDAEAVTPFAFYSGLSENYLQWSGVVRDFDAPRICRAAIDGRIDALFAKPVLANRVAAVVHGDGGCGKSTLLRRIAIDRAGRVTACAGGLKVWISS